MAACGGDDVGGSGTPRFFSFAGKLSGPSRVPRLATDVGCLCFSATTGECDLQIVGNVGDVAPGPDLTNQRLLFTLLRVCCPFPP